jgi:murein L,D-transpeptidase YcbB/YkuD
MKCVLYAVVLIGCSWSQIQAAPLAEYCNPVAVSTALNDSDRLLNARIAQTRATLPPSIVGLIDAFYGPCDDAAAWISNGKITVTAVAVLKVLRDASERGLDPNDYPAPLIPHDEMNATADSVAAYARFEVELSIDAMLLARDLRCGKVDPHALQADLPPDCEGFNPTEFVWNVSRTQNPSLQFDSLEPSAPGYQRTRTAFRQYLNLAHGPQITLPPLRGALQPGQSSDNVQAIRAVLTETGDLKDLNSPLDDEGLAVAVKSFQLHHGLAPDGLLTAETYKQLAIPIEDRVAQLALTLERWRWIQRSFAQPPIVVNIPEFRVRAYDSDLRVAISMKVIVGRAYHRKTPVFENQISSVIFRPYWNIPPAIQHKEIEPAMRRDSKYLEKHGYETVPGPRGSVRIRQRPGDQNALGLIKFSLPNVHDVYLHGTPTQSLFDRTRRDFSHGCIRLEDPVALAVWVLRLNPEWNREKVEASMHGSETISVAVAHPIPVLIVYGTGFAAEDGAVYFLPDIYNEDTALVAALRKVTDARQEAARAVASAIHP